MVVWVHPTYFVNSAPRMVKKFWSHSPIPFERISLCSFSNPRLTTHHSNICVSLRQVTELGQLNLDYIWQLDTSNILSFDCPTYHFENILFSKSELYVMVYRVSKINLENEKHVQYACLVLFEVNIDLGSPIQIYRFNNNKKWGHKWGLQKISKDKVKRIGLGNSVPNSGWPPLF